MLLFINVKFQTHILILKYISKPYLIVICKQISFIPYFEAKGGLAPSANYLISHHPSKSRTLRSKGCEAVIIKQNETVEKMGAERPEVLVL